MLLFSKARPKQVTSDQKNAYIFLGKSDLLHQGTSRGKRSNKTIHFRLGNGKPAIEVKKAFGRSGSLLKTVAEDRSVTLEGVVVCMPGPCRIFPRLNEAGSQTRGSFLSRTFKPTSCH